MKRKLVSEEELLSILNKKLRECEECKDCYFDKIILLKRQRSDGCNWHNATLRCSGATFERCNPCEDSIIFEAKKKYNIKKWHRNSTQKI